MMLCPGNRQHRAASFQTLVPSALLANADGGGAVGLGVTK
jgi:hypothetical protein